MMRELRELRELTDATREKEGLRGVAAGREEMTDLSYREE